MTSKLRTPLCPQQVGSIKEIVANNKSNGAIAASLGLKKSTVAYVAASDRRVDGGGRTDNRGRPRLLSPRGLRGLRRLVEENPFASLAEIAENLNVGRTNPPAGPALCAVSPSTVHRAIKGLRMRSCTPSKKPFVGGEPAEAPPVGQSSPRMEHSMGLCALLRRVLIPCAAAAVKTRVAPVGPAVCHIKPAINLQKRSGERDGVRSVLRRGAHSPAEGGGVYERGVVRRRAGVCGGPLYVR